MRRDGPRTVWLDVHPDFAPSYASFFFQGFADTFERVRVRYTTDGFPTVDREAGLMLLRVGAPFQRSICIAPDDRADIEPTALAWCDIYGKVNLDRTLASGASQHKLVALGPAFGVRAWSPLRAPIEFLRARVAAPHLRAPIGGRGFNAQRKRLPARAYRATSSEADYVFFAAWPWKKHDAVNPPRAEFVRACLVNDRIQFEGGFAPRRRNDMPELEGLFAPRRYPYREYIRKTGRSVVVFNTPAVHDCLGWKLGEFLALGKAVISLPLTREMPAPVEHGMVAHFVDGSRASIDDAVDRMIGDLPYRAMLERNARAYYDEWVRPDRAVRRLLEG